MSMEIAFYHGLLADIKQRVRESQHKAALSVNAEMILMYWDIGCLIAARQEQEGWGAGVIPRLAVDLKNELPEQKGFSERNIGRMIAFYRAYPILPQPAAKTLLSALRSTQVFDHKESVIMPQPAAQLGEDMVIPPALAFGIPWFHHVILIEKIKDLPIRLWYPEEMNPPPIHQYVEG